MNDDQLAARIIKNIRTKNSAFWEKEREKNALTFFHRAASEVPAYKDFLKKNGVRPAKVKTLEDFIKVPPTSKKTYLRGYPLTNVMRKPALGTSLTWSATSGSTGEPFYFPRSRRLDWEYSLIAEMHLANDGKGFKGPTLVMVCLGMGVWIAGVLNYESFKMAAERGNYPVSILTPGINKPEIFKALRGLAPHFAQTILLGYPPFLKDIVDEAPLAGVDLKKLHIRFLSGAETFTEHFREYLVKRAGAKQICNDTLNVYGSADIGSMAFETPTAILARRLALKHKGIFAELFPGTLRAPTLAQYNPLFVTFEATPEGELLLSGDSAIPLVRYA
ncbi:MAG TPA: phenylacetate--CoA ligase family protein, partial [Candidatus Paceibacterota bacterium]|nr:phenylacetate--CoA ligase family protein [Candidatus Paceibacterota bacterium]